MPKVCKIGPLRHKRENLFASKVLPKPSLVRRVRIRKRLVIKIFLWVSAGIPCKFTSPLDGITALFGGNGQSVIYAPGCADATCRDGNLFPSAVTAASEADVVVLFVGLSQAQESEGRDRESLRLPGKQEELILTVLDAVNGHPVVLVILSGGPVDLSFANDDERVGGILWAGYPGQAGGQAIAEIIFGDVNPGNLGALLNAMTWSLIWFNE
jgi:hypothetical protein